MKRKILPAIGIIVLVVFTALLVGQVNKTENLKKLHDIKLNNTQSELQLEKIKSQELKSKLNDGQAKTEEQIKQLQQEIEQRKQNEQRLEGELQAKLERKEAERVAIENARKQALNRVTGTAVASAAPASHGNCGDNMYKQYIYQHESGCRTDAVNSIGCTGIGQACPGSKIAHCGYDFACQDAWFSNYAVSRYGSWEQAYYFWLNNHWW